MNLQTEFAAAVRRQDIHFAVRTLLEPVLQPQLATLDSRLLASLLELYCQPLLVDIADRNGLRVVDAPPEVYPHFTLLKDEADRAKVAVDIEVRWFTGMSGGVVTREPLVQSRFPLEEYAAHWVVCFSLDVRAPSERIEWRVETRQPGERSSMNGWCPEAQPARVLEPRLR
ncbi:hypothetical protein MFU01_09410 [Myxococcus fulvus]|uniref:Uncharacterized protein n=1 Tax=Myxococcus fulvus TaxID=33 RepID=A0A511SVH8_MYXFU|nr:hypothetical protein [Myxococcus fulvus]GEN05904.1 hypothetical protein MFU01_09410 [Myxococcus fulvus]